MVQTNSVLSSGTVIGLFLSSYYSKIDIWSKTDI
jgi:hypothetical protein